MATSPAQTLNTIYSNGRESHWEPDTPQLRQWAKAELERIDTEQDDKYSEDDLTMDEYLSHGEEDTEEEDDEDEGMSEETSSSSEEKEDTYLPHDTRTGTWYNSNGH